jgi:hypothetical protein
MKIINIVAIGLLVVIAFSLLFMWARGIYFTRQFDREKVGSRWRHQWDVLASKKTAGGGCGGEIKLIYWETG